METVRFLDGDLFSVGLHAGKRVREVDDEYLEWVLESREKLALSPEEVALLEAEFVQEHVHEFAVDGSCACGVPPVPPSSPLGLFSVEVSSEPKIVWTEEQQVALDALENWFDGDEPFFSLTGPAGSGKTVMMKDVINRHPSMMLTAMTGKAALRLSQCTRMPASTLHKALYYPPPPGAKVKFERLREPTSYLVAIDESSMVTPQIFRDLQLWGPRVLFIGDAFQLPPVITEKKEREQYGDDYSVFGYVKGVALKTVMRNAGGILRAATKVRETGKLCREKDDGYDFISTSTPIEKAVDDYLEDPSGHLLITWKNAIRMRANHMIRKKLGKEGPLPDDGEPVLLRKNGQGYLNGEVVTCAGFEAGPVVGSIQCMWMSVEGGGRVLVTVDGGGKENGGEFFDGQSAWVEDWKKYHVDLNKQDLPEPIPVTFGYCFSCHSAQGSESRRATVFLAKGDETNSHFLKPSKLPNGETVKFSARWAYTATTRGRERVTMILGK